MFKCPDDVGKEIMYENKIKLKACFFAHDKNITEDTTIEYYANDIKILKHLGYKITIAKRFSEIPWDADCYSAWWFGWGLIPLLIAKLRRKKHICCGNIHTAVDVDGKYGGLSDLPFMQRSIMKLTMKFSDKTLLTSKKELKRLGTFRPKNASVIYHGVDFECYHNAFKQRKPYILSITELSMTNIIRKNLIQCIDVFSVFSKKYPEIVYKIVGRKGNAMDVLEKHVSRLGLENKVLFCGEVSREDKIKMLQETMIYLQLTNCEGFGLAILEAMACGTPAVVYPEETIEEVFGNSVLYAKSEEDAAGLIEKLINDNKYWSICSAIALKKAKEYDLDIRLRQFHSIFQELGLKSNIWQ